MKKQFSFILAALGVGLLLSSCREIDYEYVSSPPPVTVTPSSNSDAYYGPPPAPPVTVTPSSNSNAYYGSPPVTVTPSQPPVTVTPSSSSASYGY